MSADGSVDLAIGVEITNVTDLAKEIAEKLGNQPEMGEGKGELYGETYAQLSMMASVVRTMNKNFDKIIDDFNMFSRTVKDDLVTTLEQAFKSGEEFDIDISNIQDLTDGIMANMSELMKKMQPTVTQGGSATTPKIITANTEIDEGMLDSSLSKILNAKMNDLEFVNATLEDKVRSINDMINIVTTVLSGGVMKFDDVRSFVKAVSSEIFRGERPSEMLAMAQRSNLSDVQMSVAGTLEKLSDTDYIDKDMIQDWLKEGYPDEMYMDSEFMARIEKHSDTLMSAINILRENEEMAKSKIEEIKDIISYSGEDITISDIEGNIGQLRSIEGIAEYLPEILKYLTSMKSIMYYDVIPEKKFNERTRVDYLTNVDAQRVANTVSGLSASDRDISDLIMRPMGLESIMRSLVTQINPTFQRMVKSGGTGVSWELDIASMTPFDAQKKAVYDEVISGLGSENDVSRVMKTLMSVIEPKYIEVKSGNFIPSEMKDDLDSLMMSISQEMTQIMNEQLGLDVDYDDVFKKFSELRREDKDFTRLLGQRMKFMYAGHRTFTERDNFEGAFNQFMSKEGFQEGDITFQKDTLSKEQLIDFIHGGGASSIPTVSSIDVGTFLEALKDVGKDIGLTDEKIEEIRNNLTLTDPSNVALSVDQMKNEIMFIRENLLNTLERYGRTLDNIGTSLEDMTDPF